MNMHLTPHWHPASGVSFAIVNNLIETTDGYELEYDIYLTDEIVSATIADASGGIGVDFLLKMPIGMGDIDPSTVQFASEFDV